MGDRRIRRGATLDSASLPPVPALAVPALLAALAAGCAGVPASPPKAPPALSRVQARSETPDDGRVARLRGPVARLEEPAPQRETPGNPDGPPPEAKRWFLFPPGPLLYDPYLAAQRQSRTAVKVLFPFGGRDHQRIEAAIGLSRSLLRWKSEVDPDAASELEFEAGVFARFDEHSRDDLEASDWRFGLPFVWRDGDLAWKFHLYHLTSHLGDEFMAHTGRKPLAYHLEEAAGGLSWDASRSSRVYGEAGAAVYTGDPTYSGRLQTGYEWVGGKWTSGLAPYFAVDLQARKEQTWTPNRTVALGLAYGRNFRFGFEYYRGRDTQTQFLKQRIQWVSLGLTFDY